MKRAWDFDVGQGTGGGAQPEPETAMRTRKPHVLGALALILATVVGKRAAVRLSSETRCLDVFVFRPVACPHCAGARAALGLIGPASADVRIVVRGRFAAGLPAIHSQALAMHVRAAHACCADLLPCLAVVLLNGTVPGRYRDSPRPEGRRASRDHRHAVGSAEGPTTARGPSRPQEG